MKREINAKCLEKRKHRALIRVVLIIKAQVAAISASRYVLNDIKSFFTFLVRHFVYLRWVAKSAELK